MKLLGQQTLSVTTYAPGSYVDGVFVAGAPTVRSVVGSLQPLAGAELERLPEGLRSRATLKLYTRDRLLLLDELSIEGETYVVQGSSEFAACLLGHGKYLLVGRGLDEHQTEHEDAP